MNFHLVIKNDKGKIFADEWFDLREDVEMYMSGVFFGVCDNHPEAGAHLYDDEFEIRIGNRTYSAIITTEDYEEE